MTATKFCKILDFLTPCPLVRTRKLVSSRKCTHPPLLHALYQCLLPPWREHRVTFPRGILSDLDGTQVRLEFGDLPSFPHLFLFSMSYFPLSGSLCILLPSFPNPSGLVVRPSEKVLSGSSPFRSCWYSFVETNGKSKGGGILK